MEVIDWSEAKEVTLDIETYDPTLKTLGPGVRRGAYIVGIGIKVDDWKTYLPVGHSNGVNEDPRQVFSYLSEMGRKFSGDLIGANLLYDLDHLAQAGCMFPKAKICDVQIAEPILDDNQFTYNLNAIAGRRYGEQKATEHMKQKYGEKFISNIQNCSVEDTKEYVFGDLYLPHKIFQDQKIELEKFGLMKIFDLESRLVPMLLFMRRKGVRVDLERAEEVGDIFCLRRDDHLRKVMQYTGGRLLNINSPKDKEWLLGYLGIEFERREPTEKMLEKGITVGNPKLDKHTLFNIKHPVIEHMIAAKEYDHAYNTFIKGYIFEHNVNGRIHCEFKQLKGDVGGTVSGRLSCANPNLQNIPSPEDDPKDPMFGNDRGALMRSIFVPEEGEKWWSRDWSQIEYRLLVHYAAATNCRLADVAVRSYVTDPDTDFHKMVENMTGLGRKSAKKINFGICYGMGVPKLANSLGIERWEAEEFLETYHSKVPFVSDLFKKSSQRAERKGEIRTLLGRRRVWDSWGGRVFAKNSKPMSREEATLKFGEKHIKRTHTHKALNALLQGGAADLMKITMVKLWESGLAEKIGVHLTVHDELNGTMKDTKENIEALKEATYIMEHCHDLLIPITADGALGNNWYEAK
jgi:DNA polymerase I-like protein with 3'-5' exonuclease and polymerase domains